MPASSASPVSVGRSRTVVHLQQAFQLALSLVLFYWFALWMNWELPKYGALAIVLVSLDTTGASIGKGLMRVVGTTFGVAIGFLIIAWFGHDRWACLVAFALYLAVISYFMQASKFSYAWFVAAFVPLVVWADNYPQFDRTFYFGMFRWLETTVGVLVYTVTCMIFWPRYSGDQLTAEGQTFCATLRQLFISYRRQTQYEPHSEQTSELRTKVAGCLARTTAALDNAYSDTPAVIAKKPAWEAWRVEARSFVDALELWRQSIADCRDLDLHRQLPQLGHVLESLDRRLERVEALWPKQSASDELSAADDSQLLESRTLSWDPAANPDLSHVQRAALMSFVAQFEKLDQSSRELLEAMRVMAGFEPKVTLRGSSRKQHGFPMFHLDPERVIHALFPPAAFAAAFIFWILVYPPPGATIPMFAGILSLLLLLQPANPLSLMAALLLSILFPIAPVYWLVMPSLDSGFGLLLLTFVYSLCFGYLGGWRPILKLAPMMMFVLMTGISNEQTYSFSGLVDGALMILLGAGVMAIVYTLFSSIKPEQSLPRTVRRFFRGCACITAGYEVQGSKGQRLRRRRLESMVLPAPAKIQKAQKHLDYKGYPDNTPDMVQSLFDITQSITYRLQSLEIARERLTRQPQEIPSSFADLGGQNREHVQRVFQRWANLKTEDAFEQLRGFLQDISRDLQQQFEAYATARQGDRTSNQRLADLYTMLSAVRGLIEDMRDTQDVMHSINWRQWAVARF